MATTAAMNNKEKHAVHRLKRANVWGKFKAKYEAEIFHNLPKEHAAKAVPNGLAREFHNSDDGKIVAGLVRDVLQALGMDSTLRVFEPESSTEPLARANLKSTATTPLLVSILEEEQRRQNAQDEDDDPLRPLPSERQLQSSSSIRDESEEFDELEAELAQTMSRTPPIVSPNVAGAANITASPQKSPKRDVPSTTHSPAKQQHLSSLGDLPELGQPKRAPDPIDLSVRSGAPSHTGQPSSSGVAAMERDLDELEAELEALRPDTSDALKIIKAAPPKLAQNVPSGSLTDAAKALGAHSSSAASSSLVDAVSRSGGASVKEGGVSGAKAALPPSLFEQEEGRSDGSKSRVRGGGIGPGRRASPGAGDGASQQMALDGSYELDDASGEIFEELDESVEDADESDREQQVEDVVVQQHVEDEDPEVEIDYDDLGDATPPESIDAADGMDFELEGASLDDEDFELDTEDVF